MNIIDKRGRLSASVTHVRLATPEDYLLPEFETLERSDIYRDFFDTEAEARQFATEAN